MKNKNKLFEAIAIIKQSRSAIFKAWLNTLPARQQLLFKDVFAKANRELGLIETLLGNEILLLDGEKLLLKQNKRKET